VQQAVQQLESMFVLAVSLNNIHQPRFKSLAAKVGKDGTWMPGPGLQFKLRSCGLRIRLKKEFSGLSEFIIKRFKNRFHNATFLGNFSIFIPAHYYCLPKEQLESFGWEEFKVLI